MRAEREGTNLVELSYGRMDNLIGCLNLSPLIDEIIAVERRWAAELAERYPELSPPGAGTGEMFHLRCELETMSDGTLQRYYADVLAAEAAGRNLAEERYRQIIAE